MKKYLSKITPVFIILFILLCNPAGVLADIEKEQSPAGYLEDISFEKLSGRERINLVVSQQPFIAPPSIQSDNSLLVKLENMSVPESMRQTLGKGQLLNVTDVRALQRTVNGKPSVHVKINLQETVPYSIRQEGNIIIVDFNISNVEAKLSAGKFAQTGGALAGINQENEPTRPARAESTKKYIDRMISVDFQEADIKSVLRLMAEYGNTSIISGDDVKGNVTLSIKNVPWNQALTSILDIKGLTQKQTGDVISVMTLERKKKDEADRRTAEVEQEKADEARKAKEQKLQIEKGKLRQILIEAKIVEVTESFGRDLGIQWGFGNSQSVGNYGLGVSGGSNSKSQLNAQTMTYPPEITWTKSGTTDPLTMAAVNFPAAVAGPTFGLVFGNARGFIEAQLSALETTAQGKIISSPKVVTMDSVKAVIKQGDEVPYVTKGTAGSADTVTFKEAVLRLEVMPKITEEGRISMEIKATNDTPDYAQGEKLQGNPPIHKNEVESKVVVKDGDTVVIGGIMRNQEDKAVSGLPFFYKIPVLGWLFKTENLSSSKRQLMIFVTPKVLNESGYVEDECNTTLADKLDRCRKSN